MDLLVMCLTECIIVHIRSFVFEMALCVHVVLHFFLGALWNAGNNAFSTQCVLCGERTAARWFSVGDMLGELHTNARNVVGNRRPKPNNNGADGRRNGGHNTRQRRCGSVLAERFG